jgi:hypothetical protein
MIECFRERLKTGVKLLVLVASEIRGGFYVV